MIQSRARCMTTVPYGASPQMFENDCGKLLVASRENILLRDE